MKRINVHFQCHCIFWSLIYSINITSHQAENKVKKKGWHFEGGRQKCLLGLECKFDCPLCQKVQNCSITHISVTCDRHIYILKSYPKISKHRKHQMFFQINFPKSKCWYFEHVSHMHMRTHTLSLCLPLPSDFTVIFIPEKVLGNFCNNYWWKTRK